MNKILACVIPCIFLLSFVIAFARKVRVYDAFTDGVKGAIPLVVSVFPYVAAVTMLSKLLEVSGISAALSARLAPVFRFFGVPTELSQLLLVKPLSGSGALAALSDILETYGVDSYVARCACVVYGSSETIFYVGAVYFAGTRQKKLTAALCIAVVTYLLTALLSCFLCTIL